MKIIPDWRLARENTRLTVRRSKSFGLLVAAGVAFALLCDALVGQAGAAVEHQVRESSIMRTIEVSNFGVSKPLPLTANRIADMSQMPGVTSVRPWIQAGCLVTSADLDVPGALWATPRMPAGQPPIVASSRPDLMTLTGDEAVLPAHLAGADLEGLIGKRVTVEYTRRVAAEAGEAAYLDLQIVGVYNEAIGGRDGPTAIYLSQETVLAMAAAREGVTPESFGRNLGYPKVIVEVSDSEMVPDTQQKLSDQGYNASSIQSQLDALPPAMNFLRILGQLITGALLLMCLLAGLSIGAGLVRARLRQIGLLKALGFSDMRVARLFAMELAAFGVLATSIGLLVGGIGFLVVQYRLAGETFLDVPMAETMAFPASTRVAALLLAPAIAMLAGAVYPLWRAARVPPDLALRDPA
ncbi:ABC transporter permease [Micromonospora sp. NPDC047644]|uniref:ABC transporter permease n=1 Tax=Micromonospora sp. NPDC047644 TaxID=3157203 RepID=UPI003452E82E